MKGVFPLRIHLSKPHVGEAELAYVQEAFHSNWLSTVGPNLEALETAFESLVGLPALALASGTAGLHLGFRLLGVGPGDEVFTPTLTFAASCNPIRYLGAQPVFLDSERGSWNMDPDLLSDSLRRRAAQNRLPKAVSVVHLFGQPAAMDPIVEVCRRYELPLLEDAAESLGALYHGRHPGTIGDVGVFSFNGNKIITGTSGGMLVSARTEWVERAGHWSTQARDRDPEGLKNYVHSQLGYNYRLSNVLAGIVRGQLEVLEERVARRRAVFETYRRAFAEVPGIEPQPESDFGRPEEIATGRTRHTRWLSCFLIDEAQFGISSGDLIRHLDAANVEARPVWKPMHKQPLYQEAEHLGGAVAEDLNRRGICLPSSSNLSDEEQAFVIEQVQRVHRQARQARPTISSPGL